MSRMARERDAGLRSGAGHDVEHAGRQAAREGDLAEPQRRHRRLARRLEHDRASGRERRRDAAGADLNRIVPRHDLRRHADRLANRVVEEPRAERDRVAHDLVGDAREELEVARRHLHVGPRLPQRLAVVAAFECGELFHLVAQRLRDALHDAAALGRRDPAPRLAVECRLRRLDRAVDVRLGRFRDRREHLAGRRIERRRTSRRLRPPRVHR